MTEPRIGDEVPNDSDRDAEEPSAGDTSDGRLRRRGFMKVAGAAGLGGVAGYVARGGVSHPFGRVWSPAEVESKGMAGVSPATNEPLGVRRVFWSVPTTEQVAALTFDDGPDPEFTPRVLAALAEHRIKATFNIMGWNADQHRDLLAEVVAAGHEIGNHTWSHRDHAITDDDAIRDEMRRGTEVIEELTGTKLRWFRPPRGEVTGLSMKIAAELGQDVLVWSLSGSVDDPSTSDKVKSWVIPNVQAGAIISFHDGIGRGTFDRDSHNAANLIDRRNSEIDVLPQMLDGILARGFRFETVGQMVDDADATARADGRELT